VLGLIPDQQPMSVSSTAEGVGVDKDGNVFGAEVGPKYLKKYLRKQPRWPATVDVRCARRHPIL
jgi:hypothetical protein